MPLANAVAQAGANAELPSPFPVWVPAPLCLGKVGRSAFAGLAGLAVTYYVAAKRRDLEVSFIGFVMNVLEIEKGPWPTLLDPADTDARTDPTGDRARLPFS